LQNFEGRSGFKEELQLDLEYFLKVFGYWGEYQKIYYIFVIEERLDSFRKFMDFGVTDDYVFEDELDHMCFIMPKIFTPNSDFKLLGHFIDVNLDNMYFRYENDSLFGGKECYVMSYRINNAFSRYEEKK
jgi:hypothetical protein